MLHQYFFMFRSYQVTQTVRQKLIFLLFRQYTSRTIQAGGEICNSILRTEIAYFMDTVAE